MPFNTSDYLRGLPETRAAPQAGEGDGLITPEIFAMMAGTYGNKLKLEGLDEQMALANALRETPAPTGRQAGRVYVAENPLEHIGTGMQRFAGMKMMQDLEHGVRNKGFAPGVTKEPQKEWSKMGRDQYRELMGEGASEYAKNYPDMLALIRGGVTR